MRRRTKGKIDEKSLKQEIKTEFTQNSQDEQISLDINKDMEHKGQDHSQVSEQKLSSQSSEYEEKNTKRRSSKGKKSMKRSKKQAIKQKKSLDKKLKGSQKVSPKLLSTDNSQIISRKYSSLFFSEQSITDLIQKDVDTSKKSKNSQEKSNEKTKKNHISILKSKEKVSFWQKIKNPQKQLQKVESQIIDVHEFMVKYEQLHVTDYELINDQPDTENLEGEIQIPKILYTFEPKYQVSKSFENKQKQKLALTSSQVAKNHELFIELIRFYRNMWTDHVGVGRMFV